LIVQLTIPLKTKISFQEHFNIYFSIQEEVCFYRIVVYYLNFTRLMLVHLGNMGSLSKQ